MIDCGTPGVAFLGGPFLGRGPRPGVLGQPSRNTLASTSDAATSSGGVEPVECVLSGAGDSSDTSAEPDPDVLGLDVELTQHS